MRSRDARPPGGNLPARVDEKPRTPVSVSTGDRILPVRHLTIDFGQSTARGSSSQPPRDRENGCDQVLNIMDNGNRRGRGGDQTSH